MKVEDSGGGKRDFYGFFLCNNFLQNDNKIVSIEKKKEEDIMGLAHCTKRKKKWYLFGKAC